MAKTRDFTEAVKAELAADPNLAADVALEGLYAAIAQRVYEAREMAGLSQAELAKRAGVSQSVVAKIEMADFGRGKLGTLFRLARAMGREVDVRLWRPG